MSIKRIALLFLVSLMGCAVPNAPSQITKSEGMVFNGDPFTITVPKTIENANRGLLKGIRLAGFENTQPKNNSRDIVDFFSVQFAEVENSQELITEACSGERYLQTSSVYKSCTQAIANVSIVDKGTQYHITLTPTRQTHTQGKNVLFFPIPIPSLTLQDWYRYISNQSVGLRHKATSKFNTESIKGNFDRGLERMHSHQNPTSALARQYSDGYRIKPDNQFSVSVWMKLFPYQNGTMADMYVEGHNLASSTQRTINWSDLLQTCKKRLDEIVTE